MELTPYLVLGGRCHEAMAFYADLLGGQVVFEAPNGDGCIVYSRLEAQGQVLHGMDDPTGAPQPEGMPVLLNLDGEAEADRVFAALSEGGEVRAPLETNDMGVRIGIVRDRFGVPWVVGS